MKRLVHVGMSLWLSGCLQEGCSASLAPDAGYLPGVSDVTDTPCQSQRRALSWSEQTPLGFPTSRLRSILDGLHTQNVSWTDNSHGAIETSLLDMRAWFVDEKTSPGFAAGSNTTLCSDYVQVEATLLLSTTDGVLVNVERPIKLRAYSGEEAFGELALEAFTFEGSFQPATVAGSCFRRLLVKVLFTEGSFAGSFTQEYSRGNCE